MNFFMGRRYSAVRQTDVYLSTTQPAPHESLSPTREVFEKIFKGKFSDKPKWVLTTLLTGLCAITLGSILIAVDPYEIIFTSKVTFAPGKPEYEDWVKPEVPLYLKVYLFNVTNKEEYISGREPKLRFQQTGPYVYRELMSHENASFLPNNTIFSRPTHLLVYLPELTNGSQDDILVLPNIAMMSFAHVMRDASFFTRMGVNLLIKNTGAEPLVEMSAKEFMFGYKSPLISLGNKFMPSWIAWEAVGLIDRMYDFKGDTSTTYSGQKNIKLSGLIENYRGLPYLPHWPAPCNNVTLASDGTKFPSKISPQDELLFYRKSICRSMPMVRVGEETVNGIHGYRYIFKKEILDNGHKHPENKCFCKEYCLPSGIIDVRDCYYGFPIALSYPHFLESDPSVIEAVEGVHPDFNKHGTFFVINEASGLPLNVSVKMQINMALGDISKMANSKRFSNIVLPMLWMEIAMPGLPKWMNTKFWFYLTVGPILQTLATYLLLICGVAFLLLSLASALLIPRLSPFHISASAAAASPGGDLPELPLTLDKSKKRTPAQPTGAAVNNNKEMDMYYCSLLAVPSED